MQQCILYITYDGITDPLGKSQILPYLIELSSKGFKIQILSVEKKNNFKIYSPSTKEIISQAGIKWSYVYYTKYPPIISTLYDLYKIRQKAKEIARNTSINIVHCRSYIAAFIGLFIKKNFKAKFIFDMRGFYADERIDGNIWNLRNPIYRYIYYYFKNAEKNFLINSDYVVTLTLAARNIIQSWNLSKNPIPIEVIPCCVDEKTFNSNAISDSFVNTFKKKFDIHADNFILSYLGSIGTWYLLDEMLHFFKLLCEQKKNTIFLFITPDNPNSILKKAEHYKINLNQLIITSADRKAIPSLISISNVSIFFIKPVFSKKASSPTKLAELLAMGIPIISNKGIGDIDFYFEHHAIGSLVNNFTESEYINIINNIDNLSKIPKQNLINTAKNFFSLQIGIETYNKIYTSI